jgi:hypothetical protein
MSREITSVPVVFHNSGIILKSAADELPITAYKMLANAQTDRENSVSVRKGFTRLNEGLPATPYSAYSLKDFNNRQWRYAITNGQLYVAPVSAPNNDAIWPVASGTNFGAVTGGNNLSAETDPRALFATFSLSGTEMKPYMFMADGRALLKHSGGLDSARRVGIPKPTQAILGIARQALPDVLIEDCDTASLWTGGTAGLTTAPHYPSIWWYGASTLGPRIYYAKYSFTLNDGSETLLSDYRYPVHIPSGKRSQMFWKPASASYEAGPLGNSSAFGTYFNDGTYPSLPAGARVYGVKIRAGWRSVVNRIQIRWQLPDGTIQDGPFHGGGYGTAYEFTLDSDEYITAIKGKYGDSIDSIIFVTNKRESQKYGGDGGDYDYSLTVPAETATRSTVLIGFAGKTDGDTAFQHVLKAIGLIFRHDTYDDSATPAAGAVGWNLYVGTTPNSLRKVNSSPIGLTTVQAEPVDGWEYAELVAPLPNIGVVTSDPSGQTNSAVQISVTGAGESGRATKYFTNDVGYPIIRDLGTLDPEEGFKLSVKFADAEAKANCQAIRLRFILSDIPGDTGDLYEYTAYAEETDFSSLTAGVWGELVFTKSDFIFQNYSGSAYPELGWDTVSAVEIEILTVDPVAGGGTCVVSFDNLYYSPVGKLNGSNLEWTYTYYNSKTDTESDYADILVNSLGSITNEAIALTFGPCPYTTPPAANPDKVRIYRRGGTIAAFQLVDTVDYLPGFGFTFVDNVDDTMLGDAIESDNQLPPDQVAGIEIYDNRMFTWGGSIDGIAEPPNRLRFSKGTRIEHFPSDNYIYVGTANERILRALEHDGELFIFTTTKPYRLVGSDGVYSAVSTPVNVGLLNKMGVCRGARGLYLRAHDGIYEFPSGRKISEPINQVFDNESINGIDPVYAGRESEEAMGFWGSRLYFSYCATSNSSIKNDRMLVWDTIYERWYWYIYGARDLYAEPETNFLVGCSLTQWYTAAIGNTVSLRVSGAYPMRLENGYADVCESGTFGIPCIIDTKEYDVGAPDQEKQFIDLIVDADTQGHPVVIQATFDGSLPEYIGTIQTVDRQRQAFPMVLGDENGRLATRIGLRIIFTSDPSATSATRIYKVVHRLLVEPPRHRTFVTDWSYYGSTGPKFFRMLWVEMDTFNVPLQGIEVQIDHQTVKTITDNVTANGRTKFYYGIGVDVRGTLARLKFLTDGENEVKIYDHGFDVIPEPPLVNSLQTPYTDVGYPYRKLWKHVELDIDTEGKLIDFSFWLDGAISQTFALAVSGRQHVVQSFAQESFGKIGRLTVDMPALDSDGAPQGVRLYGEPSYVVDQRPPDVTIADSFSQTLNYERLKILKQFHYVIDNPSDVVIMSVFIDNTLKGTYQIPTTNALSPGLEVRRIDFQGGFKGKLIRFVFTSSEQFQIDWPRCHVVTRDLNTENTFRRPRLEPPQTF